ncbi:M20 family peptidase, partial [Fulvivirga sp. RKSG066]|uniref:M20/M25/M40 family metallo-hydrolase n=1 Tax=Fulvivirga aurantia TaxID=2529383 RepID=UPI0012BC1CCD
MRTLYSLILILCISSVAFGQLSKTEKKIVKAVDKDLEKYTELLKEIINMNSGTMNFEGVRQVGQVLIKEFDALGMETKWVDGKPFNRAGHLVAVNKGSKGPKMLLIGHLDTVFEPDSPFQEYQMLNDTILKGPGVADMKGGDVIIIMALKALKEANLLDKMQVEVVMTGDEEKSGSPLELSKKNLVEGAKRADIALAFENADGDPKTIVVSRRGSAGWKLQVTGNAAHSSQVFTEKVGVGAIYEASRILNEFYKQLSTEENLTFNPGVILGGTSTTYDAEKSGGTAYGKSNVVSQEVTVTGDIRAVSLEQLEKARKIMKEIASNNYPGTSAELTFNPGGYPPLAPSDGNRKLLSYYSNVSEDLGFGKVDPVNPRNAGAADVSFTSGHVDMAIDGMGLSGADDHTINETGDLSKLSVQAKRAAILMYRLTYG